MRFLRSAAALGFVLFMVFLTTPGFSSEPATVRIANATFSENVAALWIGADMGFFKKHGANVEVLQIRTGPLIMAAMASGDLQMAYTAPGPVLSAKASGMDVVFFAGIVNKADGEIIGERVKSFIVNFLRGAERKQTTKDSTRLEVSPASNSVPDLGAFYDQRA